LEHDVRQVEAREQLRRDACHAEGQEGGGGEHAVVVVFGCGEGGVADGDGGAEDQRRGVDG